MHYLQPNYCEGKNMLQTAYHHIQTRASFFPAVNTTRLPYMRVREKDKQITLHLHIPLNEDGVKEVELSNTASARLGVRSEKMFAVIQEMVVWIEDRLSAPLSVQEISRKSGYSVWHLQRTFNQLTGFSVYEFVRTRRVINVIYALIQGDKPLLDVALENGFNCQVSFTRTIRELTGFTPGYIRRNFTLNNKWLISILESLITKK